MFKHILKHKIKHKKIIFPIIVITIGALVIIAIGLLIKTGGEEFQPPYQPAYQPANVSDKTEKPEPEPEPEPKSQPKPQPQPEENLNEGCKGINYDPSVDYNFVGTLNFTPEKPADQFLEIKKDKQKRLFSLGKFKLPLETNTVLRITKLWLYFFSEKLSEREDKLYGLEDSYLSKIILKVGNKTQEINLGKSGEHMFIELDNCPLGNISTVDYQTFLEFEFLLEIGCNKFQNGACLDNQDKPLDYIDGADLRAQIRLFAVSAEEFTKDLITETRFKY